MNFYLGIKNGITLLQKTLNLEVNIHLFIEN